MTEKIRIKTSKINLKSNISEILAIRKLLENRDIGEIVATSLQEAVKAQPHTLRLIVFFYSVKAPPFREKLGKRLIQVTYKIPNVKRASLDWETIKHACGDANGYMWGRFLATANLSNGRQMQVYGSSENEAEKRLRALHELSDTKIITFSVSEQKKEGKRAVGGLMYKDSTRVYPAYFSVINSEKIQVETQRELDEHKIGLATNRLDGTFKRKRTRKIPLWIAKEPSTCKQIIREALRVRGSSSSTQS